MSFGDGLGGELAAALLHRPEILFLDEPTIGLDVTMQGVVRRFLRTYADRHGATLLLTSHYMEDVKALCPRVILIDHGALVHDGALDALVTRFSPGKRVRLRLSDAPTESLASFGKIVEQDDEIVVFEVPSAVLAESVSRMLAMLPVRDLSVEDPPLADTMARIFRPGAPE
jgi:ABC-2 type transport system ATP-binding protein